VILTDLPLLRPSNTAGKRISFVLAVIVHLALAAFLFYGVRWQTKAADIVEVELISSTPSLPSPPPAAEPVIEKAIPAETKPEAPTPAKPDIALKEKEAKPRLDPFQEQLKKEAEKLNTRKIDDSVTRELNQIKAAQEAKAVAARNREIANYLSRIVSAIRPRITLPPDLKGNPEAVFLVTQLPSGEILSVALKRSSGNSVLDINIERAIWKSSPLPKPEHSDVFSRELALNFKPLEN
jgi:colicin import membrane protein